MDRLESLRRQIDAFSDERDWGQFHTPKNLTMALSAEAGELLEHFQWSVGNERFDSLPLEKQTAIAHEVADVFMYLLRFCSVTGIDPIEAAATKLKLNAEKYPVDLAKGSSKKYSEY